MRPYSKRPAPSFMAAVVSGLLVVLIAPEAFADLFGSDIPLLGTLVSQGAQQLATASQALRAVNEDVASAQRMVGFATQAQTLFSRFSASRVVDFGADNLGLLRGTPPLSDPSRLASGVASWAPATGEVQSITQQCASNVGSSSTACRQIHDAVTPSEAQSALRRTFGMALSSDTRAGDYEVARALSAADTHQEQEGFRATVSAASRSAACAPASDPAVCALAQTARQESQLDTVNAQLAESNRLSAAHLALRNSERKRALGEAQQRRAAVTEGLKSLRAPQLIVSGDGVSLLGGD